MDPAELRPFLSLHFHGSRFDADRGMPIEMLGELVAYRDLLAEVARLVFLRDNLGGSGCRRASPTGCSYGCAVTEVDTVRMRFHLTRPDESSVPAPLDDVTIDDVKSALTQIGEGSQVALSGVGVFDRSDRLVRFDSIHELV